MELWWRDAPRRCACYASNELQPNGCVNCPVGHELPCDMNCAYRHIAVAIQFTERSEKSWRSQFMTVTPSIHFNAKALWSKPGLLFELIVPQSDIHCVSVCTSRRCACYANNELQPNGCVNCPVGHELPCDMNCAYRHIAVAIQFTERSEKSWRSQFMTVTPSIHMLRSFVCLKINWFCYQKHLQLKLLTLVIS